MTVPPLEVCLVNGLIAGLVVLGILRILASRLSNACEFHDLKVECERLRAEYARRIALLRHESVDEDEVQVVGQVAQDEASRLAA